MLLCLGTYITYQAHAYSSGITGTTQNDGGSGCSCHASNPSTATTVTISTSASTFYTGQTYDFTVTVNHSSQAAAGVNVDTDGGSLTAGSGLSLSGGELKHSSKKSGLPATWSFQWTAPNTTGTYHIYATGNAVNDNNSNSGDFWNHASTYNITVTAPPEKKIALGRTSINFGSIRVGRTKQDTTYIHSTGQANLTITSTAMKYGTHFSRTPTGTNRTINAGQSELNTITFSPTAKGTFVDTFIVNSNATNTADQRKVVVVTGTATQGAYTGNTLVAFGNVKINTTKRMSYVFQNTGDDSLFLTTPTVSGSGYTIVTPASKLNLAAGEKDSVIIEFAPTAKQSYPGSLSISAQSGITVPSISLTGAGVAPEIQVVAMQDIGGVRVGLMTQGTITVTNSGTDTLRVTNAAVTSGATSKFSVSGFSQMNIAPSGQGSITVNYTADDTTPDTAVVTIQSNATNTPNVTVTVFGTGTTPRMALDAGMDTLDFGAVRVSSTGILTFNVRNTGTDVLTLANVTTTAPFKIDGRPSTVDAGQSGIVTVKFTPTATGAFSSAIIITGDDLSNPADTIYVTGTGVNSSLNLPSTVVFAERPVNTEVEQTMTMANEGTAPIVIHGYALTGANASMFRLTDTTAHTIAAGGTAMVKIAFRPTTAGVFNAQLVIKTDDASAPSRTVGLTGTGVQGELAITPNSLEFGEIFIDSVSEERMITVKNNGTGSITITNATIPCVDHWVWNATSAITTLGPGDSVQIGVKFAPKVEGPQMCTVSVVTTEGNTHTLVVSGVGKKRPVESVRDLSPIAEFKLFVAPNPTQHHTTISLRMKRGADLTIALFDASGRFVTLVDDRFFHAGENSVGLSTSGLPSGEYFIRATSGNVMAGEAKVVVQR